MNLAQLSPIFKEFDSFSGTGLSLTHGEQLGAAVYLFSHSVLAGILLSFITYFILKRFHSQEKNDVDLILGASNIMFLCVGLTGIMILINNSLVRAFAIVAAITLVRFRAKLSSNDVNASLLFGIIIGMSFGVGEIPLGWLVAGIYVLLLGIVIAKIKWLSSSKPPKLTPLERESTIDIKNYSK